MMVSPIARRLALFVLANALLVNLFLFAGSGFKWRATVWNSLARARAFGSRWKRERRKR